MSGEKLYIFILSLVSDFFPFFGFGSLLARKNSLMNPENWNCEQVSRWLARFIKNQSVLGYFQGKRF
jgi:hypothetical protein